MPARSVDAVMLARRSAAFMSRSIKTASQEAGLRLALSMLDLTTLEGADTEEKVRAVCRKAITPHPDPIDDDPPPNALPSAAAVCVYPSFVPVAREALAGSGVHVASVATGFPSGQYPFVVRLADVGRALEAGAEEIDMVMNRGAFLAGRHEEVADEIGQVAAACREADAHLKIILETGELGTYDDVRRASDLAIGAAAGASGPLEDGAVFIKTSTGKIPAAATLPVTLVMLEAIRDHFDATGVRIGMKPAGGISSAKLALRYLVMVKETLGDAWLTPRLFRFGASRLANDLVRQIITLRTGRYAARYEVTQT